MKKSGIYCIENKFNNKKYIGQARDLNKRGYEHLRGLKGNYHFNNYLQKAFNKYSQKGFEFKVIEECREELLDEKEMFYIEKFNTMDKTKGYNLRAGGHKPRLSEISKSKISSTRIQRIKEGQIVLGGYKYTEEQKEKISKSKYEFYKNNPKFKEGLSELKATISIEEIKKIKMMLYMDMDINEIADITEVGINIITHIDQGNTFQHILPALNFYIKNRYIINNLKQISKIIKQYRVGCTYQQIANANGIHQRTAIRIVKANKDSFDEYMRNNSISFKKNKKYNMIKRMYNSGWSTVKISNHYRMSRNTISKILKDEYCKENNIPLVRIPYTEKDIGEILSNALT